MRSAKTLEELNETLLPTLYDLVSTLENPVYFYQHQNTKLEATDVCAGYLIIEWEGKDGHKSKKVCFTPHLSHPDDVLFRVVQLTHPNGFDMYPRKLTYYHHWDCAGEATIDCVTVILLLFVLIGLKFQSLVKCDFTIALDEWLPSIFWGFQAAHIVELVLRLLPRLQFFRVPAWPSFLWTLATFVGGVVAIRRFDRSVKSFVDEHDVIGDLYNLYG